MDGENVSLPPLPPGGAVWYAYESSPPPEAPFLLVEPADPKTGRLAEAIELQLYLLRQERSTVQVVVHLTFWPAGLAYGMEWGVEGFLLHAEVFEALHGFLPEGPWVEALAGWAPPAPWRLLGPTYRPSLQQLEYFNRYLEALQRLRRSTEAHLAESTLLCTHTDKGSYLHLSLSQLQAYVDALRG